MKKLFLGIATTGVVLLSAGSMVLAQGNVQPTSTNTQNTDVQPVVAQNFVDQNEDGLCDNFSSGTSQGAGQNFVDNNSDGVCDNFASGTSQGAGQNFVDNNGDGICDNFASGNTGKGNGQGNRQNFVDSNGDGICDNMGSGCGRGAGQGRCGRNINQ